ncbi:auxin-responsive protein SAUR77-like [Rutidosis leptorrhynchoides]|uniref:auxin-responsive protein SAUR77-like n=1 Tax=Rutidosis leptorrhynchoides TaxID=125765 RepID=UPI003A9978FD
MKKNFNNMLRKCKSLSQQLLRTSSYTNLRSKSTVDREPAPRETVFVGSTRKRYVIASKYLSHPLVKALIEKSNCDNAVVIINCEVVLFDHLLWMLDQNSNLNLNSESLDELAQLYSF